jgi:ketosteroid isomerase-like protein
MMFVKSVAAVSLIVIAAPGLATPAPLTELLKEEAALSKTAATLPPAEAMVSLMAPDVRLYARGGPFSGRAAALEALKANPANQGKSAGWRSIKSGISGDGTHGFTFGYLTILGGDPATAKRRYLAYWVKGAAGWRVAAFKQAIRPVDEADIAPLPQSIPAKPARPAPDPVEAKQGLIAAEKAFSDRAQVAGIGPAFAETGRADAINKRPPALRVGPAAIAAAVSGGETGPSPVSWRADDALVAPSGDLGVTFGTIRPNGPPPEGQPASIPFFTIWMRDGPDQPWRYVAE